MDPYQRGRPRQYPDEIRIGACADYLLGHPVKQVAYKWGVSNSIIVYWIIKAGFKTHNKRWSTGDKHGTRQTTGKETVREG